MMTGRASVVITNRDYGRYLADAVESALAQREVEVIVVDDGSTDDSSRVLAAFDGRVRTIRLPGSGQAAAMNAGFGGSCGDPVLFLDADDRLAPGVIDQVRDQLVDDDVARVHFPLRRIDAHGTTTAGTVPPDPRRLVCGDLRATVVAHPHDLGWQPTSGNAFRRSVLEQILPIPEAPYTTCADHYLNGLSALHGRVMRLEGIGGDYRIHDANRDARSVLDLERVRGILRRSTVTGTLIRAEAARLGLPARDRGSVSEAANRLVSLRLARAAHPVPHDSVRAAWRDGVGAAARRRDLGPARRLLATGLVTALALVPRRRLPGLVRRFVTGTTDPGPSRGLQRSSAPRNTR